MAQKKAIDTLDHLSPQECAQVLNELLRRHQDLRGQANQIAAGLMEDVCVETVAQDVAYWVGSIGIEELGLRASKQAGGYVAPSQAARDLLEESIKEVWADMERRVQAGMDPAAEKICQGIVFGLHEVDGANKSGALGYAPGFPMEAAGWSLSLLLKLYPQSQRIAAGRRVIKGVEDRAESWREMLEWVMDRSAETK